MCRYLWLLVLCACLDQSTLVRSGKSSQPSESLPTALTLCWAEDGTLPQPAKQLDPVAAVQEKYALYCSNCHGAKGGGDGVGSVALNPKPRNFRDSIWQQDTTDDRILSVIKSGGPAVGLSGTMAAFGAMFSDEEIKLLIAEIRKFSAE